LSILSPCVRRLQKCSSSGNWVENTSDVAQADDQEWSWDIRGWARGEKPSTMKHCYVRKFYLIASDSVALT
jgi:hypothetical protein